MIETHTWGWSGDMWCQGLNLSLLHLMYVFNPSTSNYSPRYNFFKLPENNLFFSLCDCYCDILVGKKILRTALTFPKLPTESILYQCLMRSAFGNFLSEVCIYLTDIALLLFHFYSVYYLSNFCYPYLSPQEVTLGCLPMSVHF